jgi:16S rRNA (guanine527-N7)-methyltransferase
MLTRLTNGARAMGIEMSAAQAEMFREYHEMLVDANARMNLTRVSDDIAEAVDRNYLDSISPVATALFRDSRTMADIGSGAGFPGIPLAIMLPHVEITLIDALGKRAKFLQDVIDRLGLNARAVHARAEEAGRRAELREQFDVVTSRAVAAMNILSELALPMVKVGGSMIAYKGPAWQEEVAGAENALAKLGGSFAEALDAPIPGRDWQHTLVVINKLSPISDKFPRRPGMPEKKPL